MPGLESYLHRNAVRNERSWLLGPTRLLEGKYDPRLEAASGDGIQALEATPPQVSEHKPAERNPQSRRSSSDLVARRGEQRFDVVRRIGKEMGRGSRAPLPRQEKIKVASLLTKDPRTIKHGMLGFPSKGRGAG
jgi:hypothetical protein